MYFLVSNTNDEIVRNCESLPSLPVAGSLTKLKIRIIDKKIFFKIHNEQSTIIDQITWSSKSPDLCCICF